MIFVDTSAWFARLVASDPNHEAAVCFTRASGEALLTTDYVADETLTLLRARGQARASLAFGESLFGGQLGHVYFMTEEDARQAWELFRRFHDKDWSFTDVTSKVVMDRLGVNRAFAFDRHFSQFGDIELLPLQ